SWQKMLEPFPMSCFPLWEIEFQESSKLKSIVAVINQTVCLDFEKKTIEVVYKFIKLIFAKI
ncbi:MAG: hypothetical protein VX714_00395, partial [Bacteroidota bacterium]|nr:hypothetical protein [Bacteroidota bacterium]